mgnify:CR=1 FL=1
MGALYWREGMEAYEQYKDLPVNDRLMRKCFEKGPEYLTDVELLAVILRTGTNGISSFDLSKDILSYKSQNVNRLLSIMHMTKGNNF